MHGSGLVSNELSSLGNFYGAIQSFAWAVDAYPSKGGWIPWDGAAIGRTDYPSLFAVISTTWGAGNGSTTFNVPNLNGFFLRGSGNSDLQMANGNVYQGGNVGTLANDQLQNFQFQSQSGRVKVGGPDTGWKARMLMSNWRL